MLTPHPPHLSYWGGASARPLQRCGLLLYPANADVATEHSTRLVIATTIAVCGTCFPYFCPAMQSTYCGQCLYPLLDRLAVATSALTPLPPKCSRPLTHF